MKKIPITIIIVLLINILFLFPIIWFIAVGIGGINFQSVFPLRIDISAKNVPENTAYVDLLIPMNKDDSNYTAFATPPKICTGKTTSENGRTKRIYNNLNIDENSGIAQLNDDGFMSFSLHNSDSSGITIYEDGNMALSVQVGVLPIPLDPNEDVRVKAAYVDENGNVLGITDIAEQSYKGNGGYTLSANGGRLVLGYPGRAPWVMKMAVCILLAVECASFLLLIVFIVLAIVTAIKKKRKRSCS